MLPTIGEYVTIAGVYKKRSFIEWLTRKEKELQMFRVLKC